jgi:hypothetical protein
MMGVASSLEGGYLLKSYDIIEEEWMSLWEMDEESRATLLTDDLLSRGATSRFLLLFPLFIRLGPEACADNL